jgi:Amt family ammonium transporter
MLGTFILWFGWYGFNPGSALLSRNVDSAEVASLAAVNTTLSAGTAGMVALFMNLWVLERTTGEPYFDLKYAMNGSLSGLVAITGGCAVLEPWAAVVTGVVAGIMYIVGSKGLLHLRLDDAVDAIPVHLVNGAWGLIAVGLFASPKRLLMVYGRDEFVGWFYSLERGSSNARLLGVQLVGLLFIMGWVMCFMLPFFVWLDWKGWFRADPLEELVGLDTSYHGGLALLGGDEQINPEYVTAYKKKKAADQHRRTRRTVVDSSDNGENMDAVEDGDDNVGEDEEP